MNVAIKITQLTMKRYRMLYSCTFSLIFIFEASQLIIMDDDKEIERQYQPSRWCKRCEADDAVNLHINVATAESNVSRSIIPFRSDIRYGTRKGQILDIYGDGALKKDSPIFVYIHGGYWQSLNKNISAYCVAPLYEAGIKVIVPDYDLAPDVSMSVIVKEIFELASFVLKMAKEDGVREVWFAGHSAGAHLSSMLLSVKWLSSLDPDSRSIFKGLFLVSGIYCLQPLLRTTVNNALKLTEIEVAEFSSILLIDSKVKRLMSDDFFVLIAVGENDSPAFQNQSQEFFKVTIRNGIESKYVCVGEVDHFNIVENLSKAKYELTKELINNFKKHESQTKID